jgi:uncharacterized membrane protein
MVFKIVSYLGWTIVLSVSLYFICNYALHYFSYTPKELGDFWPNFSPYLLIHITAGIIALLLGPFQFIRAIRIKYPRTHRLLGKIYLLSVLAGGVASLYLSIDKMIIVEKTMTFGTGFVGLAFAWLLTSGMAWWAVRNKNFVQHREWMIRSYVVTTAFVSFRLLSQILVDDFHKDPYSTAGMMSWACWALPLLITEAFLQGSKIRNPR